VCNVCNEYLREVGPVVTCVTCVTYVTHVIHVTHVTYVAYAMIVTYRARVAHVGCPEDAVPQEHGNSDGARRHRGGLAVVVALERLEALLCLLEGRHKLTLARRGVAVPSAIIEHLVDAM
jgi:hypothetical protein